MKLNNAPINAGGQLNFNVTNSLYDMGGSSGNILTCNHGFNLSRKPLTGDLLGTTVRSITLSRAQIDHVWAGQDRGAATTNGFFNNAAIGRLVLSSSASPPPPSFRFSGTNAFNGTTNALYVDFLDLSQLGASYSNMVRIDPNIIIYYAAATNSYTLPIPAGGVQPEWEEYLNGQFGGHLLWVTNFAGPNSSVDVAINGHTYRVNRALRYSMIIDSNGDGTPNGLDPNPFNTPPPGSIPKLALTLKVQLEVEQPSSTVVSISWTNVPDTVYQLQYSPNVPGNWYPLLSTNSATANLITVWDTNASSVPRFYRLQYP